MKSSEFGEKGFTKILLYIMSGFMILFSFAIVFGITVVLGYVIYIALVELKSNPKLFVNEFTIPIASSILLLLIAGWQGIKTYKKQKLWENKKNFYVAYIEWLFVVASAIKDGKPLLENKAVFAAMNEYKKQLVLWGNDRFIRLFNAFQKLGEAEGLAQEEKQIIQVYLSYVLPMKMLRREAGHKDEKINNTEFLSLFVTDPDKYEEQFNKKSFDSDVKKKLKKIGIKI